MTTTNKGFQMIEIDKDVFLDIFTTFILAVEEAKNDCERKTDEMEGREDTPSIVLASYIIALNSAMVLFEALEKHKKITDSAVDAAIIPTLLLLALDANLETALNKKLTLFHEKIIEVSLNEPKDKCEA